MARNNRILFGLIVLFCCGILALCLAALGHARATPKARPALAPHPAPNAPSLDWQLGGAVLPPLSTDASDGSSGMEAIVRPAKATVVGDGGFRWVMPFGCRQTPKLASVWRYWERFRPLPDDVFQRRSLLGSEDAIDLHLLLDGTWSDRTVDCDGPRARAFLEDVWRSELSPALTSQVRLVFDSVGLPADVGHPDSPCLVFYSQIDTLVNGSHLLVTEPDVVPVQPEWLRPALDSARLNVGCRRFWMEGSVSRCHPDYGEIVRRRDFHINGNALYCLDPEFKAFTRRVRAFYPAGTPPTRFAAGCSTGAAYESGHDHCMFQFLHHPSHWEAELQPHVSRFQYADWLQNRCEDDYDPEQVVADSPRTVLVHSKAIFVSPAERTVRRLWRTFRPDGTPSPPSNQVSSSPLSLHVQRTFWFRFESGRRG